MRRFVPATLLIVPALGLSACVTAPDRRADLIDVFQGQMRRCYILPERARHSEAAVLEVRLNPDGALAQAPKVVRGEAESPQARAAVRAVTECAPYQLSPAMAARYPEWKTMVIVFHTD